MPHVKFMLVVNEVDDWCPGILVVYVVAETRSVDHGELDLEGLFFELSLDDFDLGELVELLDVSATVVFCGGQLGRKERVDQSGLAQAGFTWITALLDKRRGDRDHRNATYQQP